MPRSPRLGGMNGHGMNGGMNGHHGMNGGMNGGGASQGPNRQCSEVVESPWIGASMDRASMDRAIIARTQPPVAVRSMSCGRMAVAMML